MEGAWLAKKLCNVLIPEAERAFLRGSAPYFGIEPSQKFHRGIWVGGTANLTSRHLEFLPNAFIRRLHNLLAFGPYALGGRRLTGTAGHGRSSNSSG